MEGDRKAVAVGRSHKEDAVGLKEAGNGGDN